MFKLFLLLIAVQDPAWKEAVQDLQSDEVGARIEAQRILSELRPVTGPTISGPMASPTLAPTPCTARAVPRCSGKKVEREETAEGCQNAEDAPTKHRDSKTRTYTEDMLTSR